MKQHIVFDVTDAGSIAASDSVGAYLRSSDGTLLDKNVVATKNTLWVSSALFDGTGNAITSTSSALDINVKSGTIDVGVADGSTFTVGTSVEQPAGGLYQTSYTALTTGKTGAFAMTAYRALSTNIQDAAGNVLIGQKTMAGSLPVVLASDQSKIGVDLSDGTGNAIGSTSGALNAFLTNTTIAVTQSGTWTQRLQDGSGNAISSTSGALNVNVSSTTGTLTVSDAALGNTSVTATAASVAATEAAILASQATGRKYLFVYNNGNKQIYVGPTGVTTASGFPVFPGSALELRLGAAVSLHAISAAGTQDTRTLEVA